MNVGQKYHKFHKFLGAGFLLLAPVLAQRSSAGFNLASHKTLVEVDGVRYGFFDSVPLQEKMARDKSGLYKITLQRDFVSDPSLYLWAQKFSFEQLGFKDVILTNENADGTFVGRYTLKNSRPASWSVELNSSKVGGFHEKVEFFVQDIKPL